MKYYDLEAIRQHDESLHKIIKGLHSHSDALFLRTIYYRSKDDKLDNVQYFRKVKDEIGSLYYFRSILQTFYNLYQGDKKQWLQHTAHIIISLGAQWDMTMAVIWVNAELEKIIAGKPPTQTEVLIANKDRLRMRLASETIEDVLKDIAAPYGWSYKGLKNYYYAALTQGLLN